MLPRVVPDDEDVAAEVPRQLPQVVRPVTMVRRLPGRRRKYIAASRRPFRTGSATPLIALSFSHAPKACTRTAGVPAGDPVFAMEGVRRNPPSSSNRSVAPSIRFFGSASKSFGATSA